MNNAAKQWLKNNSSVFVYNGTGDRYNPNYTDYSNQDIIELLQNCMTHEQEILGQDTYSFNDNSYITRNGDDYYLGNDIDDFLLTEQRFEY